VSGSAMPLRSRLQRLASPNEFFWRACSTPSFDLIRRQNFWHRTARQVSPCCLDLRKQGLELRRCVDCFRQFLKKEGNHGLVARPDFEAVVVVWLNSDFGEM